MPRTILFLQHGQTWGSGLLGGIVLLEDHFPRGCLLAKYRCETVNKTLTLASGADWSLGCWQKRTVSARPLRTGCQLYWFLSVPPVKNPGEDSRFRISIDELRIVSSIRVRSSWSKFSFCFCFVLCFRFLSLSWLAAIAFVLPGKISRFR